jgi:small-conductance mechanosensitive channel
MDQRSIQAAVGDITNALFFLPNWAVGIGILVLAVLGALGAHAALRRVLRRALARQPVLVSLLAQTLGLTRVAFVTAALVVVLPAVHLPPGLAAWIAAALRIVFVVLVGWIALTAVDIGVTVYLMRFSLDAEDNLLARKHVTQMRVLRRAISTVVVLVTAGAALMTISEVRQIGISLFASAGVAGLIAGLAARPVLSNLIAGVQLAITQPIRIEDAVIVENEWGWIEEITSTFVIVRLWDLRRMVVPLSYFMEKPFQNWTREGTAIIGTVMLYLDYSAPVERIRAKAAEIVRGSLRWDQKVFSVQVTDAKPQSIEVRVLMSAKDAALCWDLRCEVREKLIAFVQAECPSALPRSRNESVLPAQPNRGSAELAPPRPAGPGSDRPDAGEPGAPARDPTYAGPA